MNLVNVFAQRFPYRSAAVFAITSLTVGDLVTQHGTADPEAKQSGEWELDHRRYFSFGSFGVYAGPFSIMYYTWLQNRVPPTTLKCCLKATLITECLVVPAIYLPLFFLHTDLVRGRELPDIWAHMRRDLVPTAVGGLALWLPATFLNFMYCPLHLRVLYQAWVELGWAILASYIMNRRDAAELADSENLLNTPTHFIKEGPNEAPEIPLLRGPSAEVAPVLPSSGASRGVLFSTDKVVGTEYVSYSSKVPAGSASA